MSGEWTSSAYGSQRFRFGSFLSGTPLQEGSGETFDMDALRALTTGSPIPARDDPVSESADLHIPTQSVAVEFMPERANLSMLAAFGMTERARQTLSDARAFFSADNDGDEMNVYAPRRAVYKRTPFTLNAASEDPRVTYLSELEALKPGEELPDDVKERFLTDVLQVYIATYVAARPAEGTASDAVPLEILRRLGGHVATNAAWYDARYCSESDLKLYAVFCELACSVGPGSALELLMDSEYRWMWASEIRTLTDGRVVACHTPDDVREVIDRVRCSWEVAEEALYDCHGLVSEAVAHLHHLEGYRSLSLLPHVAKVD
jgi:hypothetical protein